MVVISKYEEWFDCDKGDIYPSEWRYVVNNFVLQVVRNNDACMLIDASVLGFLWEDKVEVVHPAILSVERGCMGWLNEQ